MSDIIDPIQILRDFTSTGRQIIKTSENELKFDSLKIPLDAPTAFVNSKEEQYTIGSLWLLLECRSKGTAEYMKKCREEGVKAVVSTEKSEIIDYLTGTKEDSSLFKAMLSAQTAIRVRGGAVVKKRDEKAMAKHEE